jgi:hypothetical protein
MTALGTRNVPRDGDVSICFDCGYVTVFENGCLRNPTSEEMKNIAMDPQVFLAQRLIAERKARR